MFQVLVSSCLNTGVFSSCFIQGNTDIRLLIIPAYVSDTKISVAI